MSKVVLLLLVALSSLAAFGQNTCDYPLPTYNFCLTKYGTLASLPGVLDPANAVEGWGYDYTDDAGGNGHVRVFPAKGATYGAFVTQPHGPGTLPITFDYGEIVETVTANKKLNTITFTMTIRSCKENCVWQGFIYRAANTLIDGQAQNYIGNSSSSGISYLSKGVTITANCGGVAADVLNVDPDSCGTPQATALQQNGIFALGGFFSRNGSPSTVSFTYRRF